MQKIHKVIQCQSFFQQLNSKWIDSREFDLNKWTCSKKSSPPWYCKYWKILNFCFIWQWSLIKIFFTHHGYKSKILLFLYQYSFIDVFFRKSIVEIWKINPWRTNSSINGSREQAFIEIVRYFCNIRAKIRKCVTKFD